jgi:3-oxoacyl-[acyl-carrier-protein] synthase-1
MARTTSQWTTSLTSFEYRSGVTIAGCGAVTPIGRNSLATAAAVRAGVAGFSHHAFMVDEIGRPICVAQCPWLIAELRVENHIVSCLVSAIRESLEPLLDAAEKECRPDIALFVNLPSRRPGLPESIVETVRDALMQAFAGVFARINFAQLGHAGGLIALKSAVRNLATTPGGACVIAGADSYLDPDTLEWLEETDQLHGAGERNNAWGFVPGEGAGALLLLPTEVAEREVVQPLSLVTGVGVGHESKLIHTDAVCLGEGLTTAFRGALLEASGDAKIADVYCDMNGEPYRADEFAFAVTRLRERFISASDFLAPADCWGDVGAASALLSIALASIAGTKGYSNGTQALVWASSDTGERGATLLETAGNGG